MEDWRSNILKIATSIKYIWFTVGRHAVSKWMLSKPPLLLVHVYFYSVLACYYTPPIPQWKAQQTRTSRAGSGASLDTVRVLRVPKVVTAGGHGI